MQNDKISSNNLLDDLSNLGAEEIILKYNIDNKKKPKVEKAVQDVKNNNPKIRPILYRPFDIKSCIYTGFSNGIMGRPRGGIMRHFIQANYGLVVTKVNRGISVGYSFILNSISERHLLDTAGDSIGIFPLFLYPETKPLTSSGQATQQTIEQPAERKPNLNPEIVQEIAEKLGLTFTNEKDTTTGSVSEKKKAERSRSFAPIDVLDYIYAVLQSPTYREKYKEFLKIDFPRVPYPKDNNTFWQLVKLGGELRQIHLLESPAVNQFITTYPIDGSNTITRKLTKTNIGYEPKNDTTGKVWINDEQFFYNVPKIAWEFYIGGYQPAQKWLK
ncbi:MAG: type ISP restriction/modification enzyme, partial [Flavobacteriaceae bacterium]